jgi:hypothetical protein
MSTASDTLIVGFDLGHGETALATAFAAKQAHPTVLRLPGSTRRQHITAVAEHPRRGVLLGEHAAFARDATSFYLAFKSPDIEDESVRRPVTLFVSKLVEAIQEQGDIPRNGKVQWIFGAPSGWKKDLRDRYALMLNELGLKNVEVVPESRGALLYARDAGEVQIDPESLGAGVLIVDIGSSTTDYTSVVDLEASPVDSGNTRLGAALLDREILRRVVSTHPDRARLEELMHDSPADRRRLELTCRRSKEEYFSTPEDQLKEDPDLKVGTIQSIPTREGEVLLDARVSKGDMDEVVNAPIAALGDRSWSQAFRDDLADVVGRLGSKPAVVLLTGGPSRMTFVLEASREVMGDQTVVLRGQEPEFAIARGLALAGRMSIKTRGFRQDVKKLIKSQKIENLVDERLSELVDQMGLEVANGMTERHVIPTFIRWRNGEIDTLDAAAQQIATRLQNDFEATDGKQLRGAVASWQNGLVPELEELTRPICLKWGLDPKAMKLPQIEVKGGKLKVPVDTAIGTEMLDNVGDVVSVAAAGVIATTMFGAGAAVIASTGPFAVVVMFVVALGILGGGKDAMMEKASSSNLPLFLRRMKSEDSLVAKLRKDAEAQEAALGAQFGSEFMKQKKTLVKQISSGIADDLDALAAEAEFLIS